MADDNTADQKATRVKRHLRAPETIRERTEKLQNQKDKNPNPVMTSAGSFGRGFTAPLRWLGRQIAKLGRFRVFRWISYVLLPPYIRNSWRELRLVTWPNAKQSLRLTYAVLVFSILFGIVIAVVDFGLDKLFKELILK